MPGPFTHRIDPVLADLGAVYFWWYGLSYALGFLELLLYLRRRRSAIGLTRTESYSLALFFMAGVLAGGRAVEVTFDEWPFYREHPWLIPALWLGGMATHGLLAGAAVAIWAFCRLYRKPLRDVADALVVPGAFFLAAGRVGNFIDGQIVGAVTDAWWGVKFPDAEGFRHPVVLYDGAKNLALIPLLIWIGRRRPIPGAKTAHFVFWYAFLRVFVDLFRAYPSHRLALGTGQTLNIVMAGIGAVLIARSEWRWRHRGACVRSDTPAAVTPEARSPGWRRAAVGLLLVFSLAIPGNWTQDVPGRYGKRHPGLRHSALYPAIDTAPPRTPRRAMRPVSPRQQDDARRDEHLVDRANRDRLGSGLELGVHVRAQVLRDVVGIQRRVGGHGASHLPSHVSKCSDASGKVDGSAF